MVYQRLLEDALERAYGKNVADLRIGLGYTACRLSDGNCGLGYVFRKELSPTCSILSKAGELNGMPASSMAELFLSKDLLEASIGISVINALSPETGGSPGDLLDHLEITPEDTVSMVGFFGPLIPEIKRKTGRFYVFDKSGREGALPPEEMKKHLPLSTIVLVTATTLINKTFEDIIELSRSAREICLLGPSSPLYPHIMGDYGVTILAGVKVKDPDKVLLVVSQGGGTRNFKNAVEKVVVRVKDHV